MIADIIIIALIVIFAIIGFKRGIAKTLLNIAGLLVSAISAYYLSSIVAQFVYDTFLQQTVVTNIEQLIQDKGMEYAIANSFEAVPQWISGVISFIVGLFGITLNEFEQNMNVTQNITISVAHTIEGALSSVIVTAIGVIIAILLFIIIFIIVKKLIRLVLNVFRVPVIKQVNQLLGCLLGGVEGMIFVWFAVNLFYAIMLFTDPSAIQSGMVTGEVFKFFCVAF